MIQPGDVIENPVTGERITFVRTSAQTGGALAEMDLELSPAAFLAAEHIHQRQEESFEVLEGLKAGDPVVRQGAGFLGEGDHVRVVSSEGTATNALETGK